MTRGFSNVTAVTLLAACIATSVGCYPASYYGAAYNQDAVGYSAPQETIPEEPIPQQPPGYVGVNPGLVVAGVAAAGLLGYAIGNNHGYHHYGHYGPRYYRPAYYGYGRGYYRPCY